MSQLGEIGAITAGELLDDRYRLEERVGEGGSARVYRAEDTLLGRTVAVKILYGPTDGLGTPERAQSEKALLASLNHHGLVTLYDARVSADEGSYLVMEYVEGITLRERIAGGAIEPAELASLAIDIAEALHVAHEAGIVHRDIKPSNILLWRSPVPGQGWRAKLADFGIAYLRDSARVTMPGLLVGTAAYIAPEQAQGEAPAPPADIYALGIVLIEALTGTRPFAEAEGFGAVIARLQRPVPIPESLDEGWQRLLRGMTAMRSDDRPTALDVAAAVGAISAGAGLAGSGSMLAAAEALRTEEATAEMPVASWTDADSPAVPSPALPTAATVVAPALVQSAPHAPARRVKERRRRRGTIAAVAGGAVVVASLMSAGLWWASPLGSSAPDPSPSVQKLVVKPSPTSTPTITATPQVVAPATNQAPRGDQGNSGGGNDNKGPGKNNGKGGGKG